MYQTHNFTPYEIPISPPVPHHSMGESLQLSEEPNMGNVRSNQSPMIPPNSALNSSFQANDFSNSDVEDETFRNPDCYTNGTSFTHHPVIKKSAIKVVKNPTKPKPLISHKRVKSSTEASQASQSQKRLNIHYNTSHGNTAKTKKAEKVDHYMTEK